MLTIQSTVCDTPTMPEVKSVSILGAPDLPTIRHSSVRIKPKHSLSVLLVWEWGLTVVPLLIVSTIVRLYAAFHAGLEVDEPIYRDAAAQTLRTGYPTIRAAYLHPTIPFLYHPPFPVFLLAGWFKLIGNTSYLSGRLFSVGVSVILLVLLYACTKQVMGRRAATTTLILIGCDPWIIFTNQAIYLENSLMVLIVLTAWAYWRATNAKTGQDVIVWYALTGLLAGMVIIYKQVGGFIALMFFLHLLIHHKHWLGHVLLYTVIALVVVGYGFSMHLIFGATYDAATLDQLHRTLGMKASPGLNNSASTALQTTWSQYWMFVVTVVTLIVGVIVTIMRYAQRLFWRKGTSQPLFLAWALSGIIFAAAISLKDPHYMILWIVPLYLVLAQELQHIKLPGKAKRLYAVGALMVVLLLIGDAWGFQTRFAHPYGDTIQQADTYINQTLPPTAIVAAYNYIGVDMTPQFLDITLINTPRQIVQHGVTYMALYWSNTQPIPASLGPVARYCLPMQEFSGFKDHIEVCMIDPIALAAVVNSDRTGKPTRNVP